MRLNHHDNKATDYGRARTLRNNASPVEQKLWRVLRDAAKQADLKFRRQQVVHPYIADFACMAARLLIELDGDSHSETRAYDAARDAKLKQQGFTMVRFANDEAWHNTESVVGAIITQALRLISETQTSDLLYAPLPDPPREGEGNLSRSALS